MNVNIYSRAIITPKLEAALGKAMMDSIIQERAARVMPPASDTDELDVSKVIKARHMLALLRAMQRGATVDDLRTLVPDIPSRVRSNLCGELVRMDLAQRCHKSAIEIYDMTDAGRAFVEGKA